MTIRFAILLEMLSQRQHESPHLRAGFPRSQKTGTMRHNFAKAKKKAPYLFWPSPLHCLIQPAILEGRHCHGDRGGFVSFAPWKRVDGRGQGQQKEGAIGRRGCDRTASRMEPVWDAQLDGERGARPVVGRECIQRHGPPRDMS